MFNLTSSQTCDIMPPPRPTMPDWLNLGIIAIFITGVLVGAGIALILTAIVVNRDEDRIDVKDRDWLNKG